MNMEHGADLFHITIGAAPSGQDASLDHDMRLVKAALLYAGKAKLCSFSAVLSLSHLALGQLDREQQIDFLEQIAPVIIRNELESRKLVAGLRQYRHLRGKSNLSLLERMLMRQVEGQFDAQWKLMSGAAHGQAVSLGVTPLLKAIDAGLLEIHAFQSPDDTEGMVKEFFELLGDALSSASTFPLFDAASGGLVRSGIQEGVLTVSEVGIARGRHTALAADLLQRLPLFDAAGVDEILDIRRELDRPLVRFRSAMIQFSEKIKSAAWDEDFEKEAQLVFYRDVEPAVLAIEEAVRANRLLASMARLGDKPLELAKNSALGLVLSEADFLGDVAAKCVGVGVAAAGLAYDVVRDWKQKRHVAEEKDLFFYYQAGKRLETKGPRTNPKRQQAVRRGRRQ